MMIATRDCQCTIQPNILKSPSTTSFPSSPQHPCPILTAFILEIFIGYAPSPFPATCPLIDHTSWGQDPRTTNEHVSHGPLIKLQGMKPSSLPFHHVVKGDFASC
ncbi:uncharacterized protein LACBIDRAFT_299184 [Laccaria bicolor S238N-H82]|uniref:Predicted protein n=1 Tax=Laccaria bicolor (strain S238N-H82 / ATCC MYA-4686) TaxID=486041 RepID=B0E3M4_LACBS|nr:uncharacterized protein LACBIDRAFT_299184 [Laccaria bicolor S238N-H82]EDQ98555.1 predicted protein [Laccaria bicolor S238N-H82]|eukprot:XP_001890790.1 predicted protein [Laccaria bicolor S238N-H82]